MNKEDIYSLYFFTVMKLLEIFIACTAGILAYNLELPLAMIPSLLIILNMYLRIMLEGANVEAVMKTEKPLQWADPVSVVSNWVGVLLLFGCLVSIPIMAGLT